MLKSSYPKALTHRNKGRYFEKVAIKYFLKKGYTLKDPNLYHKHIQIDALLYKKSEGWIVLEVKSLPHTEYDINYRVTLKQARRLNQFLQCLSQQVEEPVRAHLAVVSQNLDIELYEDFLCDLIEI